MSIFQCPVCKSKVPLILSALPSQEATPDHHPTLILSLEDAPSFESLLRNVLWAANQCGEQQQRLQATLDRVLLLHTNFQSMTPSTMPTPASEKSTTGESIRRDPPLAPNFFSMTQKLVEAVRTLRHFIPPSHWDINAKQRATLGALILQVQAMANQFRQNPNS